LKRVLITGAAGSIGSALLEKLVQQQDVTICAYDHNEDALFRLSRRFNNIPTIRFFLGDIRDNRRLNQAFAKVDTVFHCAALKHVGLNEYNPMETIRTNIIGTENVIEAAISSSVRTFIYTSSDKAVNPSNTMGASKLLGEKICIAANNLSGQNGARFCCVRFGNVIGTNGSVVPIFRDQLSNRNPLTITDPSMTRYFISSDEAVNLCLLAAKEVVGGEIFIRNMGSAKIGQLAQVLANGEPYQVNIIGRLPGEKNYEELMTIEESFRSLVYNNLLVVLPEQSHIPPSISLGLSAKYGSTLGISRHLRSDLDIMDDKCLKSLLHEFI